MVVLPGPVPRPVLGQCRAPQWFDVSRAHPRHRNRAVSAGLRPPLPNPDLALPRPPGLPQQAFPVRLLRLLSGAHARARAGAEFREPMKRLSSE